MPLVEEAEDTEVEVVDLELMGADLTGVMPEGPGVTEPEGLGDERPEGPGDARPEGPGDAMPEGPGDAMPEGPGDAMPEGPGDAMPEGPVAMPEGPGDAMPEGPDASTSKIPVVVVSGVCVIEAETEELVEGGIACKSKTKPCSSAAISGGCGCSVTSAPANASSGKMLRSMGQIPVAVKPLKIF